MITEKTETGGQATKSIADNMRDESTVFFLMFLVAALTSTVSAGVMVHAAGAILAMVTVVAGLLAVLFAAITVGAHYTRIVLRELGK